MTDFNIDPQQINKYMAEKMIESSLGAELKKGIDRQVSSWSNTYNSPIEGVIRDHVSAVVREILIQEYQETIRQKIVEALASKLSQEFIERVVDKATDKYT